MSPNFILIANSQRMNKCPKKKKQIKLNMKKKQSDTGTISTKKCVINGSNNLWVCVNAMNDCHTCVYCKCPSCYLTEKKLESKKCNTRGRSHRMKSIDDRSLHTARSKQRSKCQDTNHADINLIPYSDSTYFSSTYQKRIASNNAKCIPTKCSQCGAILVDK